MSYKGIAKGKIIELEEPLPYRDGQPINVSIEPVRPESQLGSPNAILKVLRRLPHIAIEDIDELERVINKGRLPVRSAGEFNAKTENTRR